MPLLFDILQKTPETSKGITRTYYAIENFVENLGECLFFAIEFMILPAEKKSIKVPPPRPARGSPKSAHQILF